MESRADNPTIRTRANHKKTAARGWEVDETTVEITFDLQYARDNEGIIDRLRKHTMQTTYQDAWEEAQRRNTAEGRMP